MVQASTAASAAGAERVQRLAPTGRAPAAGAPPPPSGAGRPPAPGAAPALPPTRRRPVHGPPTSERGGGRSPRPGAGSRGQPTAAMGFARDRLIEAGIERAGAVAAVTSGDNSNIMIARVARETYGV